MRKKVLFISDGLGYGGLGKVMVWVAQQMATCGHDVSYCTFYKPKSDVLKNISNITVVNFDIYSEPSFFKRYLKLLTKGFINLFSHIKYEKYDYVISFSQTTLNLLVPLKYILGYKLVVSERGDPYTYSGVTDYLRRKLYRFSDILVFQTEGAKNYFPNSVRKKSLVIPNPINIPESVWNLNDSPDSICLFARFQIFQKRQDILIEAFKIFQKRYPHYRLFLYGDGADTQRIKSIVKENELEESVLLPGNSTDVINDLLKHKIFAFPCDYEGMPNALMEAMSVGMPVISTDWSPKGGVSTLINNLENGIIVPRRDPEALAEALCLLASDTALMVRMGTNARESMKNFSPEKIAAMWKEVFEV